MFTNVTCATMPVAVDKDLNTVLFVHRNNATTFGGSSGNLRYDVSTDGGNTWTTNQGVLNPLMTLQARYPQAAIYNPSGNTNPSNAYLGYLAPTITGSAFTGYVNGVRQLNGTGNTENYNQLPATGTGVARSMVKGAPGIFWSIDAQYSGTAITGFRIFKGTWNGSTDIAWAVNNTLTPTFNTAYDGTSKVGDYNIAFDPTGQFGWISVLTHITPGPASYAFRPVFWRTTDGGNTWSGPDQVSLSQFSCIAPNITVGNTASTNFESDLLVDVNGEPHLLTTICNGNNAYAVFYGSWHHMYDITNTGGVWNAMDISNVNAGRGTWGVTPNAVTMDNAPQATRSADGTKLFFGWTDNITYAVGAPNQSPNLFVRGYDVNTRMWTTVRDVTACQPLLNGTAFFPKFAEGLLEPVPGQYKIAAVTGIFTSSDPTLIANFRFLNSILFYANDFTIPQPSAPVAIDQGSSYIKCAGTAAALSVTGTFDDLLWSNDSTTNNISVNNPGIYTITVRSGCTIGRDTIDVIQLVSDTAGVTQICLGDSTTLSVTGNALSYLWNPGSVPGNTFGVLPAVTSTYTLLASGTGGCADTTIITVSVDTARVSVPASATICAGDSVTLTASGVASYSWPSLSQSTAAVTVSPSGNTTYIVDGVSSTGCASSDTISVIVNPLPVLSLSPATMFLCPEDSAVACPLPNLPGGTYSGTGVTGNMFDPQMTGPGTFTITYTYTDSVTGCTNSSAATVTVHSAPVAQITAAAGSVCAGSSDTLTASGILTYNWMPGSDTTQAIVVSPAVSTTYYVTGADSNGCTASDSLLVTVMSLPEITITASDTLICTGDAATLSALGALNYTWNPGNISSQSVIVSPVTSTTYTVSGSDSLGCTSVDSVMITVAPLPTAVFNNPVTLCVDDAPLTITGGSPVGGTYFGSGVAGGVFTPSVAGVGSFSIGYAVVDGNGCTDTAYVVYAVNACVGITESNALEVIGVYPNPNQGIFMLSISAALTDDLVIDVRDLHGRAIFSETVQQNPAGFVKQIDLGHCSSGIYYLVLRSGAAYRVEKIVIQK